MEDNVNVELIDYEVKELKKQVGVIDRTTTTILDRLNMISAIKTDLFNLREEVNNHNHVLNGNGKMGLKSKVEIIWSLWIWILCGIATGVGGVVTYVIHIGR